MPYYTKICTVGVPEEWRQSLDPVIYYLCPFLVRKATVFMDGWTMAFQSSDSCNPTWWAAGIEANLTYWPNRLIIASLDAVDSRKYFSPDHCTVKEAVVKWLLYNIDIAYFPNTQLTCLIIRNWAIW